MINAISASSYPKISTPPKSSTRTRCCDCLWNIVSAPFRLLQRSSTPAAPPFLPKKLELTPLFRAMMPAEQARIKAGIDTLDAVSPAHIKAIREMNVSHPLFQQKNWPLIGIKAYLEGHLSIQEAKKFFRLESEFLRRLKPLEKANILANMTSQRIGAEIMLALRGENWNHRVFKQENWPQIALQAYLDGDLDAHQAGKLFLLESCHQLENPKIYSLEPGNDWYDGNPMQYLLQGLHLENDREFQQKFARELAKIPREERQFFTATSNQLSYLARSEAMANGNIDMANYASQSGAMPGYIVEEKKIVQFVIPPRLLQAILTAKFGDQAIQVKPTLGFFEKETLSDSTARIATIPCSLVALPEKIHDMINIQQGPGIYLHDALYHLWIESSNPHRKIWIEIANFLKTSEPQIYRDLLDRDFPLYAFSEKQKELTKKELPSDAEKFWYNLAFFIGPYELPESKITSLLQFIAQNTGRWHEMGIDLSYETLRTALNAENKSQWLSLKELERLYQASVVPLSTIEP